MAKRREIQVSYRQRTNSGCQLVATSDGSLRTNWHRYVYTICIFLNNLAFGITCSIFYPTMVDMKYMFDTSMKNISISNTFGSVGYLLGSLFGFLYKRINRQLTVIVLMVTISITIAVMPLSPTLLALYMCSFVTLLGGGAWNAAHNVWLIELWQHSSPPILQFSQFMYGLGCILAPLLVKPYLTGELSPNNSTVISNITTTTTLPTITTTDINESVDRRSLLRIPFMVDGLIQSFIPIVLLIMFFIKRYEYSKPNEVPKESTSANYGIDNFDNYGSNSYAAEETTNIIEVSDSYKRDRRLNIVLIAIFLATYTTVELAHFGYSSTYYQFISIRLSASESAEIFSIMASSFTIGRCISAFIAIKLKPKVMIAYHFIVIAVGLTTLYFGQSSVKFIWLGNVIIGFGFSAVFPAIFAFAEQYIKVNDTISTILIFSSASLTLFTPFILGPFLENSSFILLEFEIVFFSASVLLFVVILFVIKPIDNQ
ncbi:major facilitator superfamily domain-containing protein 4B-like [Oppia nitens]|uniref:major facilitator superfamily domain-containing protein 4B-like n=1 Tax=Oppia nitens TaxID=1686743 RepID=UPI0023DA842B|nr:major facilitator superfamily domain-containing protein 4B-like [Oppia nitens]